MSRKVLLVEPNYKNKYPPMGLMKIATYYRNLGDDVTFFKGDLRDLVLEAERYFKKQDLESKQRALEKIWDAFERMKTHYSPDKKSRQIK